MRMHAQSPTRSRVGRVSLAGFADTFLLNTQHVICSEIAWNRTQRSTHAIARIVGAVCNSHSTSLWRKRYTMRNWMARRGRNSRKTHVRVQPTAIAKSREQRQSWAGERTDEKKTTIMARPKHLSQIPMCREPSYILALLAFSAHDIVVLFSTIYMLWAR